jgi:hypothetical protein
MKIKESGLANFQTLSGMLTPKEAMWRLSESDYGVILDEKNTPVALVTLYDLKLADRRNAPSLLAPGSRLPPMVVAGCDIEMHTFVSSRATSSFCLGAYGVVLVGVEGVVGVLPADTVDEYVNENGLTYGYKISAPTMEGGTGGSSGGWLPFGPSDPNTTPLIEVKCTKCGYLNALEYLPLDDEDLPNCQNPQGLPHQLGVAR